MRFNTTRGGKPATTMRVDFTLNGDDLIAGVLLAKNDEDLPLDEITADMVESALREHLYERGRDALDFDADDTVRDDIENDEAAARARKLWPEAFPVGGKAEVMRFLVEDALLAGADVQVVDLADGERWRLEEVDPMSRTTLRPSVVSVDTYEGTLIFRCQTFNRETHQADVVEIEIPAVQVPGVMRQVANHAAAALEYVVDALAAGDCARCDNFRLIEVPATVKGQTTRVYCPDCTDGRDINGLRDYPRVRRPQEDQ